MNYFLDTNICIYFLKQSFSSIGERLRALSPNQIKIPSIVQAELLFGAEKSSLRARTLKIIEQFLSPYEIIAFGSKEAVVYATIRKSLEEKGTVIGANDLIIAATVLASEGYLVTHNTREFKRVKGLRVEEWVR